MVRSPSKSSKSSRTVTVINRPVRVELCTANFFGLDCLLKLEGPFSVSAGVLASLEAFWLEGTMQCDGTPNTTTGNAAAREISFGTINIMGKAERGRRSVEVTLGDSNRTKCVDCSIGPE